MKRREIEVFTGDRLSVGVISVAGPFWCNQARVEITAQGGPMLVEISDDGNEATIKLSRIHEPDEKES